MLRYAAKTLASKTLQTVLRKYLLDIELESIELPSFIDYSSALAGDPTENCSSGGAGGGGGGGAWGVSLANVKLREGVELMTLPGRRKVKRKVRRRRKKSKRRGAADGNTSKELAHGAAAAAEEEEPTPPSEKPRAVNGETVAAADSKQTPAETAPPGRNNPMAENSPISIDARPVEQPAPTPSGGSGSDMEYESDGADTRDTYASSGPPTPPARCGTPTSFTATVFCLSRGSSFGGKDNAKKPNEDGAEEKKGKREEEGGEARRGVLLPPPPFLAEDKDGGDVAGNVRSVRGTVDGGEEKEEDYERLLVDDDEDESVVDDGEEEEVEEVVEEEMVLRVGRGGRIGTLDVRLVGKDLHISVEDAYLVVEAVPKKSLDEGTKNEKDSGKGSTVETKDTTPDRSKKGQSNGTKSANDPKSNKEVEAPKAEKSPSDGGEGASSSAPGAKIMKKSGLARALASIPNLFLRDCRVRLVVKAEGADDAAEEAAPTTTVDADPNLDRAKKRYLAETVVELGIDFLSVTSGGDFLAYMREGAEKESTTDQENDSARPESASPLAAAAAAASSSEGCPAPPASVGGTSVRFFTAEHEERNEFMRKRIRTGKGPESGLWVRIFPPGLIKHYIGRATAMDAATADEGQSDTPPAQPQEWALHSWSASTEMCLFRCSGVDVHAQIHLGEKQVVASKEQGEVFWGDEYDDYTIDSMLFGVDYVAPVSGLGAEGGERGSSVRTSASPEEDEKGFLDVNGIQSIPMRSNFHRLARGMRPRLCPKAHMPSEHCSLCWADSCPIHSQREHVTDHHLDTSMPLPGLLVHFSVVDPMEFNINRQNLEVLGMLKSLFSKTDESTGQDTERSAKNSKPFGEASPLKAKSPPHTISVAKNVPATNGVGNSSDASFRDSFINLHEAFPKFMQPEEVHITGMHLGTFVVRLHIMRGGDRPDGGHSFCYWDMKLRSVTLDLQQLHAAELPFTDMRFEVGHFEVNEWKGMCHKRLVALGVVAPSHKEDEVLHSSSFSASGHAAWPCTSSSLLNVPAPLETLSFASRATHGVQMNFIRSPEMSDVDGSVPVAPNSLNFIDMNIGVMDVNTPFSIKNELSAVAKEAMGTLRGEEVGAETLESAASSSNNAPSVHNADESSDPPLSEPVSPTSTAWTYKVRLDGGNVDIPPLVCCSFPSTQFTGEKSSAVGLSMKTVLTGFHVKYGNVAARTSRDAVGSSLLSRLTALPDGLRMRILLLLDDLVPLAKALGVKKTTKSFLLCRAINKRLTKLASSAPKRIGCIKSGAPGPSLQNCDGGRRRQKLIAQLLALDDQSLEDLLKSQEQKVGRKKVRKKKTSKREVSNPQSRK